MQHGDVVWFDRDNDMDRFSSPNRRHYPSAACLNTFTGQACGVYRDAAGPADIGMVGDAHVESVGGLGTRELDGLSFDVDGLNHVNKCIQ